VCSRFSAFMKNATNVDTAASAIVRIVSAVKSFAYTQHEKKFVREDLAKSLETVLTVFHNALKYGVGVARNVPEDMPSVPVFPDEIQQVWGNLVNNAVQAMNGEGNLVIGLEFTEEEAIVRFTNDGPAISAENIERIWEPFFTTKAQGDGTGLGLSICRKIVEEGHGGRMEVSSQDGETCFTVRLPRYQPEDKMLEPAE